MKKTIPPGFSLYLDLVRFLSATIVMLSHLWPLLFPDFPLPWPGHAAVVVFFVLSGYVIAFAADRPGLSASNYALHRAVRIMSVTAPALFISILIAPYVGGEAIAFAGPLVIPDSDFWRAVWMNFFFLGESWLGSTAPPFNPPFWSLSYEVWYYLIFGVWVFSRPAWRIWTTTTAIILAGFNIAVLLPAWLLGVLLYRRKISLPKNAATSLFFATIAVGFTYYWFDCSVWIRNHLRAFVSNFIAGLHSSNQFVGDYFLAIVIAANFIAVASLDQYTCFLRGYERSIRYLASFTLSVYLFHMPLTVLIWNGLQIRSVSGFLIVLGIGIFVLGSLTERQNKWYRHMAERVFGTNEPIAPKFSAETHGHAGSKERAT